MNDAPLSGPLGDLVSLLIVSFFFGFCLIVYFIPTFIAYKRRKKNWVAIGALNLLLGWTFVGWVIAFVWSLTSD